MKSEMNKSYYPLCLMISLLAFAGCKREKSQTQLVSEKTCELHKQPLKSIFGYAAGPSLMVSPGYGVSEFNTQFGDRYPHVLRVALSEKQGEGWTVPATVEVCEECEKSHAQDLAAYLKIDEKQRRDQYMEFLGKNRPNSSGGDKTQTEKDVTDPDSSPLIDPSILEGLPE